MCDKCEASAAKILTDPEALERAIHLMMTDALKVAAGMIVGGVRTACDVGAEHPAAGAILFYAAALGIADNVRCTFQPKMAELAEKVRAAVFPYVVVQVMHPEPGEEGKVYAGGVAGGIINPKARA